MLLPGDVVVLQEYEGTVVCSLELIHHDQKYCQTVPSDPAKDHSYHDVLFPSHGVWGPANIKFHARY